MKLTIHLESRGFSVYESQLFSLSNRSFEKLQNEYCLKQDFIIANFMFYYTGKFPYHSSNFRTNELI